VQYVLNLNPEQTKRNRRAKEKAMYWIAKERGVRIISKIFPRCFITFDNLAF
jgi:hypothetical protein